MCHQNFGSERYCCCSKRKAEMRIIKMKCHNHIILSQKGFPTAISGVIHQIFQVDRNRSTRYQHLKFSPIKHLKPFQGNNIYHSCNTDVKMQRKLLENGLGLKILILSNTSEWSQNKLINQMLVLNNKGNLYSIFMHGGIVLQIKTIIGSPLQK